MYLIRRSIINHMEGAGAKHKTKKESEEHKKKTKTKQKTGHLTMVAP